MSRLDLAEVRLPLTEATAARLEGLEAFASIDSTNTYLLSQAPPSAGRVRVAIADEQTAGRGRQSRQWLSPAGAGLYLSLAYTFARVPPQLPALTLALGVGVIATLESFGEDALRLKWPNDIVARDRKLGGILTEARSGSGAGVTVVTGVGLNVDLPADIRATADSAWSMRPVSLAMLLDAPPSTAQLAGRLIEALAGTLRRFEQSGFDGFAEDWRRRDWLKGRRVVVDAPGGMVEGTAAGVDANGALVLDGPGGRTAVASGSIARVDGGGIEA
jgi:BirA family biotin operon repressor/biotin-[acetyl-CoA-carboxylase] ligase